MDRQDPRPRGETGKLTITQCENRCAPARKCRCTAFEAKESVLNPFGALGDVPCDCSAGLEARVTRCAEGSKLNGSE